MRWTWRKIATALACSFAAGGLAGRVQHTRRAAPRASSAAHVVSAPRRVAERLDVAESIYDGKLGASWQDWGWGKHDLSSGPARVVFGGYAGIIFRHRELKRGFGAFSFRFRATATWGPFLTVWLEHTGVPNSEFPHVDVKPEDVADVGGGWREALIAWKRLDPERLPVDRITISASRQVPNDWVELDKVLLTRGSGNAADAPVRDAVLAVECDQPRHRISPLIYGVSMAAWGDGATANRIGGNPISRLNWDLGATWNTGKDWFFENVAGKGNLWQWLDDDASHDARTALVVPMIGWVAKDTTSVGFPVSKFGKQRATDPYRPDAGNGVAADGSLLRPGSPLQTSVAAPPAKIAQWISSLAVRDRARPARNVLEYILDNEPSLWNETHRDVHPDPVGYDELLDRTLRYASAIRKADPGTPIAGPAEWGWSGYLYSAKDRAAGVELRPDRRAHGDVPLVPWYLRKLAEHEKKDGVRLIDTLDLHYYPQAPGIFGENARIDPEAAALRLRSTRALWDPSYVDESWIHEPVRLIPRMREWVAQNYPGLATSLGEWNFGAEDHMSGALATAEALGRFGQQELDSAFFWAGPKPSTRAFWAFRAFRDFDGAGGHFLDWSLPTKEAELVSLFASSDESRAHLVAVILNLDPDVAVRARVDISSCGPLRSRRAFVYSADTPTLVEKPGIPTGGDLVELLPPYSIEVIDFFVDRAPG